METARRPSVCSRQLSIRRKGVYVVELAFTFPILILLLFGCFEFGRANLLRNVAQNAAYEAARNVVVAGAQSSDATQVAQNLLATVGVQSPVVNVTPAVITPETSSVRVTVDFPYQTSTGIGDMFLSSLQLHGECELMREGF